MTPGESPIQFPRYEAPRSYGIPVANPGEGKPMAKLVKRMMKLPRRGKLQRLPKAPA